LFDAAVPNRFERDSTLHQLRLYDVQCALEVEFIERLNGYLLLLLVELDEGLGVLEVVALDDFFASLVEGVVDLLQVHLGNDVK